MQYQSTRNVFQKATASQAILQGLSPEGGLFGPESLPALTKERLEKLVEMDYIRRAQDLLGDFLEDFTAEEVAACVNGAYGGEKFANAKIAPLSKLGENTYLLEGNGFYGAGEYEGWVLYSHFFALVKGEDGLWRCGGFGTGR